MVPLSVTAALAVALVMGDPAGAPGPASAAVLLLAVVTVGIPHGALDSAVAAVVDRKPRARYRRLRSHAVALVGAAAAWVVAPVVSLLGFVALSAWHFGRSDLGPSGSDTALARIREVTWGAAVLAAPIGLHAADAAAVIEQLGIVGVVPEALIRVGPGMAAAAAGTHVAVRVWAWWVGDGLTPAVGFRALAVHPAGVVALTVVLVVADPLVGFACYFALWHAAAHLGGTISFLQDHRVALRPALRPALVDALVPTLALGAVALAWPAVRTPTGSAALSFVALSALTVPHVGVVEKMLAAARTPQPEPAPVP